jgi:hypothetical protein
MTISGVPHRYAELVDAEATVESQLDVHPEWFSRHGKQQDQLVAPGEGKVI